MEISSMLLMGLRKSGKTSIHQVLFQKLSPHETYFLDPTQEAKRVQIYNTGLYELEIQDFPGDTLTINKEYLEKCKCLIWIIDASIEPFSESLRLLTEFINKAKSVNNKLILEVFIHKIDGGKFKNKEQIIIVKNDIQRQLQEEIENDAELEQLINFDDIRFHCTTIYDYSLADAFSKVLQRTLSFKTHLDRLLSGFAEVSNVEQVFLFDVLSKLQIATDKETINWNQFELCSDMIEVIVDVCVTQGKNDDNSFPFGDKTSSVIKLNDGTVYYMAIFNKWLGLILVIKEDNFEKRHLIEYNIEQVKKGIKEIISFNKKMGTQLKSGNIKIN